MQTLKYFLLSTLLTVIFIECKKKKTLSPTIPSNGLIAYYPFNGNFSDLSDNKNDGQPINNPSFTTDRGGKSNSAVLLNGNNQYISVADSPNLKNLSTGVTVSAWVKINQWYLDWGLIVCKSSGQDRHFQLAVLNLDGLGKKFYLHSDGVLPGVEIKNVIEIGTWFHVAMTVDGPNRSFYYNGSLIGSVNNYPKISSNNAPLYIGRDPYAQDEYHNGALDEVIIYNRSLNAEEIKLIYDITK